MFPNAEDFECLTAEFTMMLSLLKKQNGLLQRVTPVIATAAKRKADYTLRLHALSETIRAAAANNTNQQAWAC